jgi:hypothetical protein
MSESLKGILDEYERKMKAGNCPLSYLPRHHHRHPKIHPHSKKEFEEESK